MSASGFSAHKEGFGRGHPLSWLPQEEAGSGRGIHDASQGWGSYAVRGCGSSCSCRPCPCHARRGHGPVHGRVPWGGHVHGPYRGRFCPCRYRGEGFESGRGHGEEGIAYHSARQKREDSSPTGEDVRACIL